MRRRTLIGAGIKIRRVMRTGEHCPAAGWWATTGSPPQFIPEGSLMPSFEGRSVTWAAAEKPGRAPARRRKEGAA
jgi:hypothetical protein